MTHETLEARIARAEHVVGTIAKVTETVITAPGGRATEGPYEYALVLKIDERLKGTRIDLAGTAVTDESLKRLAGLTNLAYLDVSFTTVTHEGLKPLAGLKKLALIQLDEAQVTAAMLGTLREMEMLHTLPHATGAVRDVRPASDDEIVRLELYHIPLTDAGLKELVGLKNLADLRLQGARVTDSGLKELARLPKLTTLFLLQMKLTDAMLKEVAGIKSLTTLGLYGTKYPPAALADLQQTLPKCKIER